MSANVNKMLCFLYIYENKKHLLFISIKPMNKIFK